MDANLYTTNGTLLVMRFVADVVLLQVSASECWRARYRGTSSPGQRPEGTKGLTGDTLPIVSHVVQKRHIVRFTSHRSSAMYFQRPWEVQLY
jgi:hypothetical protein